jgi:hypothetical protein
LLRVDSAVAGVPVIRALVVAALLAACAEAPVERVVEGPPAELVGAACDMELAWFADATGFVGQCPEVMFVEDGSLDDMGDWRSGETASPVLVLVEWRQSLGESGFAHELIHALTWQADPASLGDYDHESELWTDLHDLECGIAAMEPLCDDNGPPVCPRCEWSPE